MTLRSTALVCRGCDGSGTIATPAGLDACRGCAVRAEREWQAAQRGRPLPVHLTATPIRTRPTRDRQHHRSIA